MTFMLIYVIGIVVTWFVGYILLSKATAWCNNGEDSLINIIVAFVSALVWPVTVVGFVIFTTTPKIIKWLDRREKCGSTSESD